MHARAVPTASICACCCAVMETGRPTRQSPFRLGSFADALRRHPQIDVAYTLEINEWNGERKLQLNVKDFVVPVKRA
jgi:hypothetical protein